MSEVNRIERKIQRVKEKISKNELKLKNLQLQLSSAHRMDWLRRMGQKR